MAKLVIYEHEGEGTFTVVEKAAPEIMIEKLFDSLEKGFEVFARIESEKDVLLSCLIYWENEEDYKNKLLSIKWQYALTGCRAYYRDFSFLRKFFELIFERGSEDD